MEVSAPGVMTGGRGGGGGGQGEGEEAGKERGVKDRMAQVVPVDDAAAEAEVVVPYVMAVDDSSVDRAVITALLRRSKYRGTYVHLYIDAWAAWRLLYSPCSFYFQNELLHFSQDLVSCLHCSIHLLKKLFFVVFFLSFFLLSHNKIK